MRPSSVPAFLEASLLAAALLCSGCKTDPPELAIRKVIDKAVSDIEGRRVSKAAEALSETYKDTLGRSRRDLRLMALWALKRGPVILILRNMKVEVQGERATVTTVCYAVQGKSKMASLADLAPNEASIYNLTITMALESGDWKVKAIDGDNTSPSFIK